VTRKRNDNHSTEFGLWLRNEDFEYCQAEVVKPKREQIRKVDPIESGRGFVTTNLDFIWRNYKKGFWMLIEEKRNASKMYYSQKKTFKKLHQSIQDQGYKGFHLIRFEETNPNDGRIILDNEGAFTPNNNYLITKSKLIEFLQFEAKSDYYETKTMIFQT